MSSQELEHQNNGVHFFKIILASILQEGKLRVPINFARRHWHGITNPVTLRLPTMAQMNVTWEKTSDYDVWFCNGWKEFANYLSLRDSQLLVFRYRKKSLFDVIVFGKCGLEIKYPLRETCDGSLKVTEDPSSSPGKRRKSPSPCVKVCKKMKINPEEQKESKHEKKIFQSQAKFHNFKDMNNGNSRDDIKEKSKVLYEKVNEKFSHDKDFFACMIKKTHIERDLLVTNYFI
ncbi:putative transcription factor B3-Domain family [Medicago truncatula]|uniref:Putative transcription factor B3-Domain family n=1 Tax=Medicago truncatula TaxID=3880 RepID=A0A396HHL2_MEDTR|nr:putative transcription factor B3-Domain family [Medicago truncatula]